MRRGSRRKTPQCSTTNHSRAPEGGDQQRDHRERHLRLVEARGTGCGGAREHARHATDVQHGRVPGHVDAAPAQQVPTAGQPSQDGAAGRVHTRLPASSAQPTSIAASARLNGGHDHSAMKSTTAPRASRSATLPAAPPTSEAQADGRADAHRRRERHDQRGASEGRDPDEDRPPERQRRRRSPGDCAST